MIPGLFDFGINEDDQFKTQVSCLLHFNGTNASTTFTDSSVNNLPFTVAGGTQLSTLSPKFGTASGAFDGNGDYIFNTDTSAFEFTGDFTVELWVKRLATQVGSGNYCIVDFRRTTTAINPLITLTATNGVNFQLNNANIGDSPAIDTNWHHVAMSRSGTTVRCFVDGVTKFTSTLATSLTSGQITIATFNNRKDNTNNLKFAGFIDELRVTKAARYVDDFTPPQFEG